MQEVRGVRGGVGRVRGGGRGGPGRVQRRGFRPGSANSQTSNPFASTHITRNPLN